ncbi:MAG: hypothetical protein WBV55_03445 [Candidatus Sulfotelmatobacter sp.]
MTFRTTMTCRIVLPAVLFLAPACSLCQLIRIGCDHIYKPFSECNIPRRNNFAVAPTFLRSSSSVSGLSDGNLGGQKSSAAFDDAPGTASSQPGKEGFHWGRALTESLTFLLIEQAYVVHTDFRWVVSENGIPFNHYWRDYKQSLSEWTQSGWDDGDPNWFGYVGHPIQGALTGFIQIQNDPKSERLEFSKTKAYWKSRLKAALWNTVYSMQWNLGPLSEVTVEKYGTKDRMPWNSNGSYPCNTNHCFTGVGQIDIVMTPLGGTGWLIGEDFLDKKVVRHIEESTNNRFLIDTVRVVLNPIRSGANMLHGEHPWYRASRENDEAMSFSTAQKAPAEPNETPQPQFPNHGSVSFGYIHAGVSRCEVPAFGTTTTCDPVSSASSNLGGWDTSVEKMYLRYFGAIADFSGQYGGVSQTNFLFGLRGGAWTGRFRPFGQAMIGAVRVREDAATGSTSETSFAEDLGLGIDFRVLRLVSWRNQVDELKTGSPDFERRNLRLSSGFAVRF